LTEVSDLPNHPKRKVVKHLLILKLKKILKTLRKKLMRGKS
jgi:hypothetical protein